MLIDNTFYMSLALNEAWKYQGLTYPNPAVGCTIVGQNGEILAVEAHHRCGGAHAEVNALKFAYYKITNDETILALNSSIDIHNYLLSNHDDIFINIKLFTTLEPCSHYGKTPSCASLICELGIKEVYVGSYDTNKIAQNGNTILQRNSCTVHNEVLLEECEDLLLPFKKSLEKGFVYFKWAQRLNATTNEGNVSSLHSRTNVHALRDVCELLVIGGNTVRIDRPTLDARLVNGKAPDILIYSREKEFDKTIPLFNVKGRKVFIESDFEKLQDYKNIMIEGTDSLYELTREIVDCYLCYIAPSFGGSNNFNVREEKFDILNIRQEDKDIIMWMKRI
ncbi:bifunctional diaminohydroxyphosphoribosylaminopyrimidine deaminase/5-amino-6-(5-phosphoribosylamino)uracil reductase RibD [Sulfurimonas sp. SAG-AH-194-L11]|nr:bifunctional diaminohydroxyphosphoribosylaminopyrimidine deaminase/5-amino-6-(5-phosphoribosylamino)uracil reductase RibD [Sulfurimonas sp. SAG-AH-194-L11]MDF1876408.1 bifunctional diaminohydroxyphosphoribosylaminopyrimidine deaminase/5-amino-6-(5-phosphoribosylamino)uracil reductase RibD [Sulfurimonas sp. SAG-AH-194-L11]